MEYDNNLTGIISRNERKDSDQQADIKGQCEINGVEYWIDGWQRTRKSDGGKFYSLKFKPKQETVPVKKSQVGGTSRQTRNDDDGSIPF